MGNVHGSCIARWKARCRLPISGKCNYFCQLLRLRRYERISVEIARIVVINRGWVTLMYFQGE